MSNTGKTLEEICIKVDTSRPQDYVICVDSNEVVAKEDFEQLCKQYDEIKWQLDTLKKEIVKQDFKYLVGFIKGIEDQ